MDHTLFNVNEDFSRVLQNDDVLFYEDGRLYGIYDLCNRYNKSTNFIFLFGTFLNVNTSPFSKEVDLLISSHGNVTIY